MYDCDVDHWSKSSLDLELIHLPSRCQGALGLSKLPTSERICLGCLGHASVHDALEAITESALRVPRAEEVCPERKVALVAVAAR